MTNHAHNRFRKRVLVTGNGSSDLVVPPTLGGFDQRALMLATALTGLNPGSVVVGTAIPLWVPQVGTLNIQTNSGGWVTIAHTSWTGSTFTIGAIDFTTTPAAVGNAVKFTMAQRVVLDGWQIIGNNTAGTLATFTVRNKVTTANVLFGGSIAATTGAIQVAQNGLTVPGTSGETIEVNVAAFAGQIEFMVQGYFTPADNPSFLSYV